MSSSCRRRRRPCRRRPRRLCRRHCRRPRRRRHRRPRRRRRRPRRLRRLHRLRQAEPILSSTGCLTSELGRAPGAASTPSGSVVVPTSIMNPLFFGLAACAV